MKPRSLFVSVPSLAFVSVLATLPLLACSASSRATSEAADAGPIEECEAFLAAYEHCLDSLGPPDVTRARIEQTRAGLAAQLEPGGSGRAALRKTCADNRSQLAATCR